MEYHSRDLCVIPIKPLSKKPALRTWKQYQKKRPDEKQLRKWFKDNDKNIAVVLGPVSGDLVCRDFDDLAEYERWKQSHKDLAEILPTVKTGKGIHVYCQAKVEGRVNIEGSDGKHLGELRGSRHYCLMPPSVHPDGPKYEWVNPLNNGNLLVIDPELAGFLPSGTEQFEQTQQIEQNEAIRESGYIVETDESVKRIITETIPRKIRTRNKQVWDLIRTLKADQRFFAIDPIQLKPIVRLWHEEAKSYIRTKNFEETWIDFLYAWERNILPKGEDPMTRTFERVKKAPLPEEALRYENPKLQLLVAWCKELQPISKGQPFWLSARTVARHLKVHRNTAWRYLFLLVREKVLDEVERGEGVPGGKATRFRYIAN